jgi:hypothetical protein
VAKGARGADVVQVVRDSSGPVAGTILWESKRAATWSNAWVKKLREDQRRDDHTVAVVVSDALPDPERSVTQIDGIWVTNFDGASDLATILRTFLIQVANARGTRARRDDMKGLVYDYVAGPEFASRVRALVHIAHAMRNNHGQEKRALQSRWAERETQIDAVIAELAGLYGDLRGLGTVLPRIETLELSPVAELPSPSES